MVHKEELLLPSFALQVGRGREKPVQRIFGHNIKQRRKTASSPDF